ncbi:MAG: hypothetical protein PWP65_549 [Clostridia bacterium]|nr:hypothetical protein [Clostridia bacterium]
MPPHKGLSSPLEKLGVLLKACQGWWRQRCGRCGQILAPAVAALILVSLAIGWYKVKVAPNAWAVLINGEQVAIVAGQDQAEKALQELLAEKGQGLGKVNFADRIAYTKIRAEKKDLCSQEKLKTLLASKLNIVARAVALRINGEDKLFLKDKATAEAVLEKLKESYIPPGEGEVEEVKIQEEVSLVECEVKLDEISSEADALAVLKNGRPNVIKYKVKEGDSFWTIAQANGLQVEELQAANPEVDPERLNIGQEINLTKVEPLLHVVAVLRKEVKEPIPYEVEVVNDSNLLRGQEKIKQPGVEGEQRVVYQVIAKNGTVVGREVLEKEVLKEPQTKVISRGTRLILASRGGGSGQLTWPARGPITSGFGYRGREFHAAIDIGVPYGTPVRAAEAGVVIFVGYYGGYGRSILIDHGDGLMTRYAHLAGYEVKVGEQVERGEVIGYSGNSGRSTGPHLHFEVLINGTPYNPLEFLR